MVGDPSIPEHEAQGTRALRMLFMAEGYREQADRCIGEHIWLGAIVLAGAALEALLISLVLLRLDDVRQRVPTAPEGPPENWELGSLIFVASRLRLVPWWREGDDGDAALQRLLGPGPPGRIARLQRNWIHPGVLLYTPVDDLARYAFAMHGLVFDKLWHPIENTILQDVHDQVSGDLMVIPPVVAELFQPGSEMYDWLTSPKSNGDSTLDDSEG